MKEAGCEVVCVYSVILVMLSCCLSVYISREVRKKAWKEIVNSGYTGVTVWLRRDLLCEGQFVGSAIIMTGTVQCPACSPIITTSLHVYQLHWFGLVFSKQ